MLRGSQKIAPEFKRRGLVRPTGFLEPADFVESVGPADLVYLLLNGVGGDTQICLLPGGSDGARRALVVDVAQSDKLAALISALRDTALLRRLPDDGCLFPLVVGTHPHEDRIGGMPGFLETWGERSASTGNQDSFTRPRRTTRR